MHAEIHAARTSNPNQLQGCSALIVRIGENDALRHARPCQHCTEFLKTLPIDKVYFVDENGEIQWVRKKDLFNDFVSSGHRDH